LYNLKNKKKKKKDVCYSRRRRAPFRARSLFLRDPRIVAIVRVFVHFYSLFFGQFLILKKKKCLAAAAVSNADDCFFSN
jgi:hypothetical protein